MKTELNQDSRLAENIGNAWRYWERRRLAYNGALILLTLGWLVFTWPHFRPAFNFRAAGALVVLAVLANLGYSAAYIVEAMTPFAPVRAIGLRGRNFLWLVGTLFALALEMYWIADEIYPHPTGP